MSKVSNLSERKSITSDRKWSNSRREVEAFPRGSEGTSERKWKYVLREVEELPRKSRGIFNEK
ncbi:hypothetical protein [Porphyromonas sp.]|uniref:hypothetical protein n=1 Tax=Porphyromonas sp. TaxID=1924944 RepID=UPI001CAFA0C7|nr:hypothetical protein [Porphyromonas sp.]MBF1381794.1 hypothetical protein [Porphyromonas sp.]